MFKNKYKNISNIKNPVSIIFSCEGELQFVINIFKNLREQSYKNVEYVFLYSEDFNIEKFKEEILAQTDFDLSIPAKYILVKKDVSMFNDGIKEASGDVLFLKACNPVIWYKNHIVSHLEKHQEKKFKKSIVLSNVETKNLLKHENDPTGTLGYRITKKISPNDLLVDEISFTNDVKFDFENYSAFIENNKPVEIPTPNSQKIFDSGKFYKDVTSNKTGTVNFTNEISVVLFVPYKEQNLEELKNQTLTQPDWSTLNTIQSIQEKDGNLSVRHYMPTLFGNIQIDEQWNNKVRELIKEHWEEIISESTKRVVIKRTAGMGDVLETEPIVRYYKNLGFEVWYVTGETRGCKEIVQYFKSKPNYTLYIPENRLTEDVLGYNKFKELLEQNGHNPIDLEFDLRIDLDLAYESRKGEQFGVAYFKTIGLSEEEIKNQNLIPNLISCGCPPLQKTIAVSTDFSGWGGKGINKDDLKIILEEIKNNGYKMIHTSNLDEKYSGLEIYFERLNIENNFVDMKKIIESCDGFIGADGGAMHVANAFDKEILVWSGAANPRITTASKNLTIIEKEGLECLGCRHKIFYELVPIAENQVSLTFVPNCTNEKVFTCMNNFDVNYLQNKVKEFLNKL